LAEQSSTSKKRKRPPGGERHGRQLYEFFRIENSELKKKKKKKKKKKSLVPIVASTSFNVSQECEWLANSLGTLTISGVVSRQAICTHTRIISRLALLKTVVVEKAQYSSQSVQHHKTIQQVPMPDLLARQYPNEENELVQRKRHEKATWFCWICLGSPVPVCSCRNQ
jgi:hypothetical protein